MVYVYGSGTLFCNAQYFLEDRYRVLLRMVSEVWGHIRAQFGSHLIAVHRMIWFERGSYYPQNTLETIGCGVGFGMWVSNMVLEIWTLDPIRKYDLGILDEQHNIDTKRSKALTHIRLHALLCIGAYICVLLNG